MGIGIGKGVSSGSTTYWHPDPIVRLNMGYDVVGNAGNRTTGSKNQQSALSPMASALIQRAMASQANAPSLAALFPSLGQGLNMGNPMMGNYTGQFGAGRFLAPNISQFGGQQGIMSGFAPMANTNNTTT